ncbi:DUF475 domain-containing protein [Actinoplanes rectilineatus]|uniref:DUF475 domain-containing protein n=1 Tax=Actinoplanes rectilineatus TaxID=113571 RepID=UPI0005F278CD|nr:DUF475 domain-containing protein [Actinoplanes rectilineatus]
MLIRVFGWSFAVTAAALIGALALGGTGALALVAILCVLEISLSFDNAVVNATVLKRMNAYWQRLFLTVGIIIAVFGMRLVFPLLLVAVTAQIGPAEVVRLALAGGTVDEPGTYAAHLHEAHPSIAAFGGMFLLMLFLNFVFEDRAVTWLGWLERPLARIGRLDQVSVVTALIILVVTAETLADEPATVLLAGVLGVTTYVLVNGLGEMFETDGSDDGDHAAGIHGDALAVEQSLKTAGPAQAGSVAGKAAFSLFLYLEVLDASFSFDGVIGAFAITQDIFIIATGLGVGAMYIRSITIYLVRKGSLDEYAYLEHGAHWAIGALAAILLISIRHEVPEIVTGLVGVTFIAAAMVSSIVRNRRGGLAASAEDRRNNLIDA